MPAQREWQSENGTYSFSSGLGVVEVAIGLLVLAGLFSAPLGAVGAVLAFCTSLVTLSFLVTTPEAWVPALGDAEHGFPYLSGAGRLVLKDVMLFAGGFLLMVDSARALRRRTSSATIGLSPPDPEFCRVTARRTGGRVTEIFRRSEPCPWCE